MWKFKVKTPVRFYASLLTNDCSAPQVLQLEMEKLSLARTAPTDRAAASRLAALEGQLDALKVEQADLTQKWESERADMQRLTSLKVWYCFCTALTHSTTLR
jgi:hypothetical protein